MTTIHPKGEWYRWGLTVLALVITLFSVQQVQILADKNKNGVQEAQLEALRNCIRANINSAVVQITATGEQNSNPKFERIADKLFPVLDCKKTLLTKKSVMLAADEVERYVWVVKQGRFPIVLDGKIVGSRSSLLEGVESLDQAGQPPQE